VPPLGQGQTPVTALLLLASFPPMLLGTVLAARLLQARGFASLFGARGGQARAFAQSAAISFLFLGALTLATLGHTGAQANMPPRLWLMWLPLGLAGLAAQTLAEELLFRGYLLQQVAARFGSAALAMAVSTVLFAAMHFDPASNGANNWPAVATVGLFGLIAADLTRRTGSLAAAWGLHWANNIIAILVLPAQGPLTGLALYVAGYGMDAPEALVDLALNATALVVLWVILVRRFGR
jgi:membrane protease YdiL (CAAX protease family)